VVELNKHTLTAIIIIMSILLISGFFIYQINDSYEKSVKTYNDLLKEHNLLITHYNDLWGINEEKQAFQDKILSSVQANHTAVTILYYTNYSQNQEIITLSVPYEEYNSTIYEKHPYWNENNLESAINYITPNESMISQIVSTIKNQTQTEEELGNALLDFVQDKQHGLSVRYYPTNELKYPIETLVEMGGDCDTHAFLYGTLMKSAGFKVLLLLSKEEIDGQPHAAVAIHLENPPENSLSEIENKEFLFNGEKYYYAESTSWNWRIGDIPPNLNNLTFYLIPI